MVSILNAIKWIIPFIIAPSSSVNLLIYCCITSRLSGCQLNLPVSKFQKWHWVSSAVQLRSSEQIKYLLNWCHFWFLWCKKKKKNLPQKHHLPLYNIWKMALEILNGKKKKNICKKAFFNQLNHYINEVSAGRGREGFSQGITMLIQNCSLKRHTFVMVKSPPGCGSQIQWQMKTNDWITN